MITPEQEETIFQDIWREAITVFALPLILFTDTFEQLQKALFRGFGANIDDFAEGTREFILLTKLKANLNFFSAAKTFQNVRDTAVFRLDEGQLRPFPDFRKDAKKIFDQYNENWLKTEFDTVVAASQSADQWKDIEAEKKTLPLLKYQTAGDDRVRPSHVALDGIVKPVDDSFWDTRMPPNDFNCFEPNTKILTPNGWQKISIINKGDYIIGGSGEKRNVIGVHINKSKGVLIKLESKNSFILCTPNHRILTIKGWIRADELKKSDIIIQQPKSVLQNAPIRNINKVNTLIRNIFVTLIIQWWSLMSKAFNPQFQFRNININPIRPNIIIKNRLTLQSTNIIKHYLLTFSWFCFKIWMSFREIFKCLFSCDRTFVNDIPPSKRSIDFHFFRSLFKRLVSFFSFTKIRMWILFIKLFHKFSTMLALLFSSFGIINPLRFYRFASLSGFNSEMLHQFDNSSLIHVPSFTKHPVSKKLSDVKISNGFFSGAPFNRFNSLKDFIRYSFFHFKFIKLDNITKIQYTDNVYNLSIEKDESYITELGIVHNCRCIVISLEEGEEKITNLGEHLKTVKKKTGVTNLDNDSELFSINPGKKTFIFKDKGDSPHPYFKVPGNMKLFKKRNFGLPTS